MSGCDTTRANYPISFSESYEQFLKNRPANFKMPIPNLDIEVTVAPTKDPLKIKEKRCHVEIHCLQMVFLTSDLLYYSL